MANITTAEGPGAAARRGPSRTGRSLGRGRGLGYRQGIKRRQSWVARIFTGTGRMQLSGRSATSRGCPTSARRRPAAERLVRAARGRCRRALRRSGGARAVRREHARPTSTPTAAKAACGVWRRPRRASGSMRPGKCSRRRSWASRPASWNAGATGCRSSRRLDAGGSGRSWPSALNNCEAARLRELKRVGQRQAASRSRRRPARRAFIPTRGRGAQADRALRARLRRGW